MLAAVDVATVPVAWTDGPYVSPLTVFEAMAASRPVVAAAIGQVAEILRHGETGLLYPVGDAAALANAIASLLLDRRWAAALGRAAQADIRRGRAWDGNAQSIIDMLHQARLP